MSEMAVRHPKRGKAHRRTSDAYVSTVHPNSTVCGRWAPDLTDRLLVSSTDPSDRCKTCWPTPAPTTPTQAAPGRRDGEQR